MKIILSKESFETMEENSESYEVWSNETITICYDLLDALKKSNKDDDIYKINKNGRMKKLKID